jgi:hypothetical protein
MRASGYFFALRYLAGDNPLGNAEVDEQSAVGNGIGLLWELDPDAALGGATQGLVDGQAAVACAKALSAPEGAGISFSEDFGPTGSQWTPIEDYWNAARAAVSAEGYLCGGYGAEALVTEAWQSGILDYAFVSAAWLDPGIPPATHLVRQQLVQVSYEGTPYDVDYLMTPGCGLWNRDGLWPETPPTPKEVEMLIVKGTHNLWLVSGCHRLRINEASAAIYLANGATQVTLSLADADAFLATMPEAKA